LSSLAIHQAARKTGFSLTSGDDTGNKKPTLCTALEEQLGLRLEPQKRSEEVLVIDHLERPSKN
jgi:uncharacterized protein (TIGR03435 family)